MGKGGTGEGRDRGEEEPPHTHTHTIQYLPVQEQFCCRECSESGYNRLGDSCNGQQASSLSDGGLVSHLLRESVETFTETGSLLPTAVTTYTVKV